MAPWFCQKYADDWNPTGSPANRRLADPQAVDWCLDTLRQVIKAENLDMLEHDQTMVTDRCEKAAHRHTASARTDTGYRAPKGIIAFMTRSAPNTPACCSKTA